MKVEKVNPALLESKSPKSPSPREQARVEQEKRIDRMLSRLTGSDTAFRIRPGRRREAVDHRGTHSQDGLR